MKKYFAVTLIVLFLASVFVPPAFASGLVQTVEADPFAALTAIMVALLAAPGVGSAFSFLIQLGKMFAPKWFPDETAQNWRLGAILVTALLIYFVPTFYPPAAEWLNVIRLDAVSKSFAEFGLLVMPLFVWIADWIAKKFYQSVLRGTFLGKSYSGPAG